MCEGEAEAHGTEVFIAKVPGCVDLVLVLEDGRRIVDDAGWSEHRLCAAERRIDRSGKNKRFEDGTCRPAGNGVIQLAHAIVASSGKRQDSSSVRIDTNQRDLSFRPRTNGRNSFCALALTFLNSLRALLTHQFIDLLHADVNCLGRGPLQSRIDSRVDAITIPI